MGKYSQRDRFSSDFDHFIVQSTNIEVAPNIMRQKFQPNTQQLFSLSLGRKASPRVLYSTQNRPPRPLTLEKEKEAPQTITLEKEREETIEDALASTQTKKLRKIDDTKKITEDVEVIEAEYFDERHRALDPEVL